MKHNVSSTLDPIDQAHFNQMLFQTIGSFKYIAFKYSKKSEYSKYWPNCCFNEKESIDEAINKATFQFHCLMPLLDTLINKVQKVHFPPNVQPEDLAKDINT